MTLELILPKGEFAVTGKQVTFEAPCDSANLTKVRIKNFTYDLVDSIGNPLVPNAFAKGAMVSVILNNESSKAFIQNPSTTKYLEEWLNKALSPTFTEARTLENIQSGENLSTLFGKIAKLISSYMKGGNSSSSGGASSVDITATTLTLSAGSKATVVKTLNDDGSINFTFGIPRGSDGADGVDGEDGKDGVSPVITVSKNGKVTTLTVINADGTISTADILDGEDGEDGENGSSSEFPSSYITADKVNGVTTLTLTHSDSTSQEVQILDGKDGKDGKDGNNGADGITPNIQVGTVTTLNSGSKATVTRRTGSPNSAPVFDFSIPRGYTGYDGKNPVKGVDYFNEEDKKEIAEEVLELVPTTTAIDFSNWYNGSFTETLNDGGVITHKVLFNDSNEVISIAGIAISGLYDE